VTASRCASCSVRPACPARAAKKPRRPANFCRPSSRSPAAQAATHPLPPTPSLTTVEDLQRLAGNQQLAAIRAAATQLEANLKEWTAARDLAAQRVPVWQLVTRMAGHATTLPTAAEAIAQIEAIRTQRSLLQPQDGVSPLRRQLADLLRAAVQQAQQARWRPPTPSTSLRSKPRKSGSASLLPTAPAFSPAPALPNPPPPTSLRTTKLLAALEALPLAQWHDRIAALPARFAAVAKAAAELLEPKVQHVHLASTVLRSEADVKQWLAEQEKALLERLKSGPVVIS
jgi:predicted GIY-YIG superfamily endonuclease